MHSALWIVVLVATVTAVTAVSRRAPLPAPLLLTVVGVVASFIPDVPEVTLTPELVLVGFLPPLLYATALRTSLVDFRRNRRPIIQLSVGLVLVTTFVVALVVWWLLPVPAVAVAVGAVVAPPDAVAATAVARRVGMPRRMVTILEGESLVNDATALVALRTRDRRDQRQRSRSGASASTSSVRRSAACSSGWWSPSSPARCAS